MLRPLEVQGSLNKKTVELESNFPYKDRNNYDSTSDLSPKLQEEQFELPFNINPGNCQDARPTVRVYDSKEPFGTEQIRQAKSLLARGIAIAASMSVGSSK